MGCLRRKESTTTTWAGSSSTAWPSRLLRTIEKKGIMQKKALLLIKISKWHSKTRSLTGRICSKGIWRKSLNVKRLSLVKESALKSRCFRTRSPISNKGVTFPKTLTRIKERTQFPLQMTPSAMSSPKVEKEREITAIRPKATPSSLQAKWNWRRKKSKSASSLKTSSKRISKESAPPPNSLF